MFRTVYIAAMTACIVQLLIPSNITGTVTKERVISAPNLNHWSLTRQTYFSQVQDELIGDILGTVDNREGTLTCTDKYIPLWHYSICWVWGWFWSPAACKANWGWRRGWGYQSQSCYPFLGLQYQNERPKCQERGEDRQYTQKRKPARCFWFHISYPIIWFLAERLISQTATSNFFLNSQLVEWHWQNNLAHDEIRLSTHHT